MIHEYDDYNGYPSFKINNQCIAIHRLVGNRIFGKKPGYTINHKDGNKHNNAFSNLEYVTIGENTKHAITMGLHITCHPERLHTYKDGRASKYRIKEYKHEWYMKNKETKNQT